MSFIFEFLIIAILIGGAYVGIRFGFIGMAAKPLKLTLSLYFAFSLCSSVGRGIIAPIIQKPISNYVKSYIYKHCSDLSPENVISEIPTLLKISGAAFDIDVDAIRGMTTDSVVREVVLKLTHPFVSIVAIVISFLILFFVGKLIVFLGISLVRRFCEDGVLSMINKAMGFVLAGFLSFCLAWAFVGITEFLFHSPLFSDLPTVSDFNGGFLFNFFNSISPLELLLSF